MTQDRLSELREMAAESNKVCDFYQSGIYYTLCSYTSFGLTRWDYLDELSNGFHYLFYAALNFRLSGDEQRAKNRGKQGLAILEDVRENVVCKPVEKGICREYEGDLRVVSGSGGAERAYEQAIEYYQEYENNSDIEEIIGQMAEPSIHDNTEFLRILIEVVEFDIDEDRTKQIEFQSPVARIKFKMQSFESIINTVLDRGELLSALEE